MGELTHQRRQQRTDQQTQDSGRRRGTVLQDNRATAEPVAQRTAAGPGGLPEQLKSGIESLSGMSMDHVRVHYGSPKPAQLNARAYAQGNEIHMAPGQSHHLPHEAWHVVQQAQGRVRPTVQMGGTSVNDDRGLEAEADSMGARAAASPVQRRADGASEAPRPAALSVGRVLQGNFPDAENDERRTIKDLAKDQVQLDHMVPQEALRAFSATLKTLDQVASDPKSRWEGLKEALDAVREIGGKSKGAHELLTEGHLVNIQENIVPGRADQIQGAGNFFDPKMESGANGVVKESAFSLEMRKLDDAIRELNQLVHADVLPTKAADSKKNTHHNSDVEDYLVNLLTVVSTQLTALNAEKIPTYTPEHWYQHAGKWVKKRSATWLDNPQANQVGGGPAAAAVANWTFTFNFDAKSLAKDGARPTFVNVPVQVTVNVPPATWAHIFERHYLSTFKWDIQAVNTFWKTNPVTYLQGAGGQALLTSELTSLLKKHFNFSKPVANADDGETSTADWSQAEGKLFFQGKAKSEFAKFDIGNGEQYEYDVTIDLKSIAPQSEDLAFAITPAKLTELKPPPPPVVPAQQ